MAGRHSVEIRLARPDEYGAVGDLTARVYLDDRLVTHDSPYVRELRDAIARARETDLIVAAEPDDGAVLGSVAFVLPGSTYAELAGDREAEFRMLVVDREARGRGVGARLVGTCIERARAVGATTLRLSTQKDMVAAHRLYEGLGFERTPERDHSPVKGVTLLTYALDLGPVYCCQCGEPRGGDPHERCAEATRLPRWCPSCRRPLAVEDTPAGWTARCARHGDPRERSGRPC